ncbi:MAG: DUF6088 family protein [Solirubrobacteraceae bacterium]
MSSRTSPQSFRATKRRRAPRKWGAANTVRRRVERGGARFWRAEDFAGLPPAAVATALSRLAREGELERVAKGAYYRSKPTALGPSVPSQAAAAASTLRAPLHPAGLTAANALGLTTQNPARAEYATSAPATPTALRGAAVHTRRPAARAELSAADSALLETLRSRARFSDLSPERTVDRLLRLLADEDRFERLAAAALSEPPRVRAMLGALGQQLGGHERALARLSASLNPLSRFDFGMLRCLHHAREWQAK